jgi:hypothetical protein
MSNDGWLHLEKEWISILRQFEVSAYRSSDCNASKGEYAGWRGDKKDSLREQLIDAMHRSWRGRANPTAIPICPVFTWSTIDIASYERISSEYPQIRVSPYEFQVLALITGSKSAIKNLHDGVHTLGVYFEEGQDVRPHNRRIIFEEKKAESRIVDISFVRKVDHIPLQVADMIAYEAWKSNFEGLRKPLAELLKSGCGGDIGIDDDFLRKAFGDAMQNWI